MRKKMILLSITLIMLTGCGTDDSKNSTETFSITTVSENNISETESVTDTAITTDVSLNTNEITSEQKKICLDAARIFSDTVSDAEFEAGETINIDKLMLFFTIAFLKTDKSNEVPGLSEYTIEYNRKNMLPKKMVNDFLEARFDVIIDDSDSHFYGGENLDFYYLEVDVRGETYFNCTNLTREGDIFVLDYESGFIDPVDENDDGININGKYRMGIKLTDDGKACYAFNRELK